MTDPTIDDSLAKRNIARFCVENPHVTWALLLLVLLWGYSGYQSMPKSKDPNIPVRIAMVSTPWPGHTAIEVEQRITRQVEQKIAESAFINQPGPRTFAIQSITLPSVSMIQVQLAPGTDRDVAFNDLNRLLQSIENDLPDGAGPITVNSEFGDTAAVLLAVASPKADSTEIALRSKSIAEAIDAARAKTPDIANMVSIVVAVPLDINPRVMQAGVPMFRQWLQQRGLGSQFETLLEPGFIGFNFSSDASDQVLLDSTREFLYQRLGTDRFYADAWNPTVIRDTSETRSQLSAVAGDKYSYRQLDDYSDTLAANIKTVPQVSRVLRSGVLDQQITMNYSQEVLASYGILPSRIGEILNAWDTQVPGGVLPVEDMNVVLNPQTGSDQLSQLGKVIITQSSDGVPVYLRSVVDIRRDYQTPPRLLNFYTTANDNGEWQRHRAVGVAVQMHAGEQIAELGSAINTTLSQVRHTLPDDLIIDRVSNQPTQVSENIHLFMRALYEAILLVVLVALIGFWEWRSALLLMLSIPVTLALTFGFISVLGIDIQQVSIAALIIALGLLVDDPVVASDAIKRSISEGRSRAVSAWLGPTLLATAILFATITNIVAYLPFLLITGNQGAFLYSLPIVMASALIASRIVSMTFVPFLGNLLLRAPSKTPPTMEQRRSQGFTGMYYRLASFAVDHRKVVLIVALILVCAGLSLKTQLKNAFFPDDVQYISTIDIWMKNGTNIEATNLVAQQVEAVVRKEIAAFGAEQGATDSLLESLNTTVGGGAPRFWFTVSPQQHQSNYAQLIVRVTDKDLTPLLAPRLQTALSQQIAGADIDVKQLQTTPVNYPVAVRLSSRITPGSEDELADIQRLRGYAAEVEAILKSPAARTVRNDWADASLVANIAIDEDRANLAGISNQDIATSSLAAINGIQVGEIHEGDRQIPIVAQLQLDQRARFSDLRNLYVYSMNSDVKVPIQSIASTQLNLETERIRRLEQFRTITVFSYPAPGYLSADIMKAAQTRLDEFAEQLPEGYLLQVSGNAANTTHGFSELIHVMGISVLAIFMALVFQFRNLIKPLLVFAAVPFGMAGALLGLYVMNEPFGFMAFLGIVSLIGVIVSHIIVLFDFIEDRHRSGAPFREALLDAGVMRLRPVLITIAATTLALLPLASEGGPLWQGLCYAQIGGLIVATSATLVLVPVLYAFVVLDLKWIKWQVAEPASQD